MLAAAGAGALFAGPPAAARGKYMATAGEFLNTLITRGTDRYGRKHTPLFCLSLDPETHTPPRMPEKIDRQYAISFEYLYRDYGYYWKSHLHSSSLIYDQGTIRALYAMTDATKDPKYARAADACLKFFLDNMVSEQTGMFGWGEHICYNVFLDYIIGSGFSVRGDRNFTYDHELERWTTIYDIFWEKDPAKTLNEIEGIYEYKIHDYNTFVFNRHSGYYGGRTASSILTFIKHSGLFVHAFALAYVKTGDKKYAGWARKMADLFWNLRDPRTGLVRGCIQRKDENVAPAELAQLVLFLLRAYQWHPDPVYLERSLAYLKAYRKFFLVNEKGDFRDQVHPDGTDRKPGQLAEFWEGPIRMAKAAVLAYSLSGDQEPLELARIVAARVTPELTFSTMIQRSLISDEIEARNVALSMVLDLYEVTGDRKCLDQAKSLADDAARRFLYRGLFVSSMQLQPEGDKTMKTRVYDARSGAGWLALNLMRLQRDSDQTDAGKFRKLDRLERIYD